MICIKAENDSLREKFLLFVAPLAEEHDQANKVGKMMVYSHIYTTVADLPNKLIGGGHVTSTCQNC